MGTSAFNIWVYRFKRSIKFKTKINIETSYNYTFYDFRL